MRLASIVTALLGLASPLSATESPASLSVYPRLSSAPATVRITIVIPRDLQNRQMCLVADGEGYYRSSCWDLPGEAAPHQTVITYPDLPAGRYEAVVTLERDSGTKGRTTFQTPIFGFRVLGFGEGDPEAN